MSDEPTEKDSLLPTTVDKNDSISKKDDDEEEEEEADDKVNLITSYLCMV